jgi:hypothetical protein
MPLASGITESRLKLLNGHIAVVIALAVLEKAYFPGYDIFIDSARGVFISGLCMEELSYFKI